MPIYQFTDRELIRLEGTTFGLAGLHERRDLQRLLREHVEVIAPDLLVIAEEFGDWEDSKRRIDLLAVDKEANLVVIELKRTEDGGHMELQAIRYASMVSTLTFDQVTNIFGRYLAQLGKDEGEPRDILLDFLGWDEPDKDLFAQRVRILLVSAEFAKELASSVLWLIDHDVDIRCVRLKPYRFAEQLLVDVQQIIPLPEAADYQFQVREKVREERQARASNADFTRYDVHIGDEALPAMWKRNAVFAICKRLCDGGIKPDEIARLFDWRSNRVWYAVDGVVDPSEFDLLAKERAASGGPSFDPRRWFCGNDQLVHADGKTYAFSKMWGGKHWSEAMGRLRAEYPQFKIEFFPTT